MRIDSYTVYYYVHFIRFIFSVFDLIFDLNLCNMHINTVTNYLRGTCGCGKSMSINRCLIRGMFHLYNNRNRTWFWHLVCIIFFIQQYQMNKKSLWKIRTNHIWKKRKKIPAVYHILTSFSVNGNNRAYTDNVHVIISVFKVPGVDVVKWKLRKSSRIVPPFRETGTGWESMTSCVDRRSETGKHSTLAASGYDLQCKRYILIYWLSSEYCWTLSEQSLTRAKSYSFCSILAT